MHLPVQLFTIIQLFWVLNAFIQSLSPLSIDILSVGIYFSTFFQLLSHFSPITSLYFLDKSYFYIFLGSRLSLTRDLPCSTCYDDVSPFFLLSFVIFHRAAAKRFLQSPWLQHHSPLRERHQKCPRDGICKSQSLASSE